MSRAVIGPLLNIDIVLIGVGFGYNLTLRNVCISESFWVFWQIARNLHILEKFLCKRYLPEKNHSRCSVIPWPLSLTVMTEIFKKRNININIKMKLN